MFKLTAMAFVALLAAPPVPDAGAAYLDALLASRAAVPIATVSSLNGGALALHVDSSATYVRLHEVGYDVSLGDVRPRRDDPQQVAQVPVVRTKWFDADGMEHEVSTPVASSTTAGIERAIETHQSLVTAMQRVYPARRPPPP